MHVGKRSRLFAWIGKRKPGEAARRRYDESRAEWRGMEAVGEREPFAAGFPFAGRHCLVGDEEVVQAAGAGEADLVACFEHARGFPQQAPRAVERECRHEFLRGQPCPAAKQVVQFVRGDAAGVGDRFDLGLATPVLRDEGDGATHDGIVVDGRGRERLRIG